MSIENGPTMPRPARITRNNQFGPTCGPTRVLVLGRPGSFTAPLFHVRAVAVRRSRGPARDGGHYARDVPRPRRIAFVSMHTSPGEMPGSGDAGGMNVVERAQAEALAALGHRSSWSPAAPRRTPPTRWSSLPGVAAAPPGRRARRRRWPRARSTTTSTEFAAGLARLGPYRHHPLPPLDVRGRRVARWPGSGGSRTCRASIRWPPWWLRRWPAGEPPESPGRVPGEAVVARGSQTVVAISAAEAQTVIDRCGADAEPGVDRLPRGRQRAVPPARSR